MNAFLFCYARNIHIHQAMLQIFAMYGAVVQGGGSVQSDG